jgi:hypothetical protein
VLLAFAISQIIAQRELAALRLRALEAKISASPAVAGTVLSLSAPDEPSLEV